MGQLRTHRQHYETFRADAYRDEVSSELRVEAFFLAAFQLIEACAAQWGLHIGKHQNVRRALEVSPDILGLRTRDVWRAFQDLETRFRPKFVYGIGWTKRDFAEVVRLFELIESHCKGALPR